MHGSCRENSRDTCVEVPSFVLVAENALDSELGTFVSPSCQDLDEDGNNSSMMPEENLHLEGARGWEGEEGNWEACDALPCVIPLHPPLYSSASWTSLKLPPCARFQSQVFLWPHLLLSLGPVELHNSPTRKNRACWTPGDVDCLVGERSGSITFFRNDGSRANPVFNRVALEFPPQSIGKHTVPALGDVDGDGDLDCVVGNAAGEVHFLRNDGTRRAPRFVWVTADFLKHSSFMPARFPSCEAELPSWFLHSEKASVPPSRGFLDWKWPGLMRTALNAPLVLVAVVTVAAAVFRRFAIR